MSSESQLVARPRSQLAELLVQRIREAGRITFYDWMKEALYHSTLGYYNRADLKRWGQEGDYRTSPERSELFAATFARYFAALHKKLDQPAEFNIVEMGAGNGEFAAVVLETLKRSFANVFSATRYLIIETSQISRQLAEERLLEFRDRVAFADTENLQSLDSSILFTNELLDAFPVHRLTFRDGELKELFVTLNDENRFVWVVADPSSDEVIDAYRNQLPPLTEGQIVEVNLGIKDWMKTVEGILKTGYLITVDYGDATAGVYSSTEPRNGTLRAFRKHQFVDDVLSEPGEYDITSNIDWTLVATEGKQYGFQVEQLVTLDRFLMQAEILDELEYRLSELSSEAARAALTTSAREMILPGAMASSFQVLVQKR